MKIDIVIPNFNGADILRKNLPHIVNSTDKKNSHIIIVDDNSSTKDQEKLIELLKELNSKRITLKKNKRNLGFSSTVNKGVQSSNADLVVLLNSDVIPEKNFLSPIRERFQKNKNLFGVGCMDKSIENGKRVLRGRGIAFWENGFLRHKKGEVNAQDTFWISGGSSVVHRERFEKLGGFDELFNPFYWEDIDLSFRAQKSGYDIVFEKESVVTHRHEQGAIKTNFSSDQVKKIAFRNELIFIWKNITDNKMLTSHIYYLSKLLGTSLIRGNLEVVHGFLLAIQKVPKILIKRSAQKKLYTLTDRDLIPQAS